MASIQPTELIPAAWVAVLLQPLLDAAGAGVIGGGGEHVGAVVAVKHVGQVLGAQTGVVLRVGAEAERAERHAGLSAICLAVAGISCIRPRAPAVLAARASSSDSWCAIAIMYSVATGQVSSATGCSG